MDVWCCGVGEKMRGEAAPAVYVRASARIMFTVKEGAVNMMTERRRELDAMKQMIQEPEDTRFVGGKGK